MRDSLTGDAPRLPISDPSTVVENEAKRMSFYHASLLDYIKERPRDSNAPRLGTTQLHCHNDHFGQWFTSSNSVHPINCAVCDVEGGSRWSCASCGLRVCQECCEKVKSRAENTEFGIMLREAKEETERRRLEMAARRARSNTGVTDRTIIPSRPGSPNVYPPSDFDTPYGNQRAASSTNSLPGNMRLRPAQGEMRAPQPYAPSAWQRLPAPPYGRPPGSRQRMSVSSLPALAAPPTPRIPDQYLGDRSSKIFVPQSSKGSEMEMRGQAGNNPERGQQPSTPRYGNPMRVQPDARARSRPRAPPVEFDPMAELRKAPAGPYPEMPRNAGARTPGSMR
jgi:hypothetical protein